MFSCVFVCLILIKPLDAICPFIGELADPTSQISHQKKLQLLICKMYGSSSISNNKLVLNLSKINGLNYMYLFSHGLKFCIHLLSVERKRERESIFRRFFFLRFRNFRLFLQIGLAC